MDHQLPLSRNDRLRVEYVNPATLKPRSDAPRQHPKCQLRAIKTSLETFGQVLPILADGEKQIISGLALWQVMQKLGFTEVMVMRIEYLTEPQIKAMMIA